MEIIQSDVPAPGRRDKNPSEVCLVVLSPTGIVLVSKASYVDEVLRLPTAGIDPGETPDSAAKRGLAENLGLQIEMEPLAQITHQSPTGIFTSHLFLGETGADVFEPAGDEVSTILTTPLEGLLNTASRLEALPSDPRPNDGLGTWLDWGTYRAVSHRVAEQLISARQAPLKEAVSAKPVVRVLGPVEVSIDGLTRSLTGLAAQVLTALALQAPQPISKERLREWFWDDLTADTAIESTISRLRTSTGLKIDRHLVTVGNSYRLELEEVDVDARSFEALIKKGFGLEETNQTEAAPLFRRALALWRGRVGAGCLASNTDTSLMATRLDSYYADARQRLFEIELAAGNNGAVLADLPMLCADYPDREALWGILATAFYREGQQRQALLAIDQLRNHLIDSGLTLNEELEDLEKRIIARDPALNQTTKASYRSDIGELQMYWGFRPAAHQDIRSALLGCRSKLVAAGMGLSTVIDLLSDPAILNEMIARKTEVTLVMARPDLAARQQEQGGERLEPIVLLNLHHLEKMMKTYTQQDSAQQPDVRSYAEGFVPRHFFLQIDDSLFVGSYLAHQQGSHSYLMKLRDQGDHLYKLFADELAYVLTNTVATTVDALKGNL